MRQTAKAVTGWARTKVANLDSLTQVTGSVEGWLRAELVLAAQRGDLGSWSSITAEAKREDLTLERSGTSLDLELKVAFNNKNLIGGYNGTGGISKDLDALADRPGGGISVVWFCFYNRRVQPLGKFYNWTAKGIPLQPTQAEDFREFAPRLADAALATKLVDSALRGATRAPVTELLSHPDRWMGLWVQPISGI